MINIKEKLKDKKYIRKILILNIFKIFIYFRKENNKINIKN